MSPHYARGAQTPQSIIKKKKKKTSHKYPTAETDLLYFSRTRLPYKRPNNI